MVSRLTPEMRASSMRARSGDAQTKHRARVILRTIKFPLRVKKRYDTRTSRSWREIRSTLPRRCHGRHRHFIIWRKILIKQALSEVL